MTWLMRCAMCGAVADLDDEDDDSRLYLMPNGTRMMVCGGCRDAVVQRELSMRELRTMAEMVDIRR